MKTNGNGSALAMPKRSAVGKVRGRFRVVSKNTRVRRWIEEKRRYDWVKVMLHSVHPHRNRKAVAVTENKAAADKIEWFLNYLNDSPVLVERVLNAFAQPVEEEMSLLALASSADRERYHNAGRVGHKFGD